MRIVKKGEKANENNPVDVLKEILKEQESGKINMDTVLVIIKEIIKNTDEVVRYRWYSSNNMNNAKTIYDMEVIKSIIIG